MTGTVTRQYHLQRIRVTFKKAIKGEYVIPHIGVLEGGPDVSSGILSKRQTGFTIYFGSPVRKFEYTVVEIGSWT